MSKKQQKKLAKRQFVKGMRKEKKQALKAAKRAKREAGQIEWDAMTEEQREEQRQRSAIIREQRGAAEAAAAAAAAAANDESRAAPTCVVDLDFGDLMHEREIGSLAQQLSYCYCSNRRAGFPLKLAFTSFGGALEAKMTIGHPNWVAVKYAAQSYVDLFDKDKIVYLSSESEDVLETPLRDDTAYVVGGLVDHNRQKGLTHRLATEAGVRTARLPIDEHLAMSTRRVLAVNHVVELLVHLGSGLDWPNALLKVIPERRGAKEKASATSGASGQDASDSGAAADDDEGADEEEEEGGEDEDEDENL